MDRTLKVCSQCQHEHYFEDFCPSNCDNCNSPLVGNAYPVKLLDQVRENLLTDPIIWEILQPPK